jgi:transcription initiation factor IIE alpha subunit
MDRYYVSIPDPNPTPEGFQTFRKDQFSDLVRGILCAFYDDGEIMVANFLLESDIAHTDQQIAEALGLPQRQVRAILEARLCKDFVTEVEIPNVGPQTGGAQNVAYMGASSAWYRISPNVLSATWYRLTQTERKMMDRLKSVQENESYVCMRCGGREFDSLRAVSLYSSADGLFHCDICEDILQMRQNKQIREQTENLLSQFRDHFEPVKERLESMSKMCIPRPIVIKKTVHEKLLEQSRSTNGGTGNAPLRADFNQLNAALTASISTHVVRERETAGPEWIREAQNFGESETIVRSTSVNTSQVIPGLPAVKRPKLEEVVIKTNVETDIKSLIKSATNVGKKEEESKIEVVRVMVGGREYEVEEIRGNEALIDQMTDEEYTQYDALIQSLGFR